MRCRKFKHRPSNILCNIPIWSVGVSNNSSIYVLCLLTELWIMFTDTTNFCVHLFKPFRSLLTHWNGVKMLHPSPLHTPIAKTSPFKTQMQSLHLYQNPTSVSIPKTPKSNKIWRILFILILHCFWNLPYLLTHVILMNNKFMKSWMVLRVMSLNALSGLFLIIWWNLIMLCLSLDILLRRLNLLSVLFFIMLWWKSLGIVGILKMQRNCWMKCFKEEWSRMWLNLILWLNVLLLVFFTL